MNPYQSPQHVDPPKSRNEVWRFLLASFPYFVFITWAPVLTSWMYPPWWIWVNFGITQFFSIVIVAVVVRWLNE